MFGLFLYLVAIPHGVTSPRNVPKAVLSPVFWPQILAGGMAVIGALMVLSSLRARRIGAAVSADMAVEPKDAARWARLAGIAGVMAGYFLAIPWLGMVWASMPAFVAVALLVRTRHPVIAVVTAICLPLILYAFFYYVAGVAIPQGKILDLS